MLELRALSTRSVGVDTQLAVEKVEGSAADGIDPINRTRATGFSLLRSATPEKVEKVLLEKLRELSIPSSSCRSGSRLELSLDDGLNESFEEQVARLLAAMDLGTGISDPRRPRGGLSFDLGRTKLSINGPSTRQPTLLQLARDAVAGRGMPPQKAKLDLEQFFQGMTRGRGLDAHLRDLGAPFAEMLESCSGNDRILNLGAGEARLARDLFGSADRPLRSDTAQALAARSIADQPSIVSVDLGAEPEDFRHPKHRYVTGLFSKLSKKRLGGPFKAVIDMLGCFTYTRTLSQDLQKSLDVLETGGRLWIGGSDTLLVYRDDRLMLLPEWLATIDGLEVDFTPPAQPTNGEYLFFSVKKTRDDVTVDPLRLIVDRDSYGGSVAPVHIFSPSDTGS